MLATPPTRVVRTAAPRILARAHVLHPPLPHMQHPVGLADRSEAHHHIRRALHAHPLALRRHERIRVEHVHDVRTVAHAQPAFEGAHGGRGRSGNRRDLLLGPWADGG